MKLHATAPGAQNSFSGYGEDYVLVNGQRHTTSMIVMPEQVLPWRATTFATLAAEDFAVFLDMKLEILLLGTGPRQRFPAPALVRALTEQRIGVESMDLKAACRTYNILMAEGRNVAAALVFQ
ncbi:MAG TPA: Mth938-like domain-containing protein [Burkholderiales bacterium]